MARTEIRSAQIKDGGVKREDLNTTEAGQAVVTHLIAGTGISLSSSGVEAGTGAVEISSTAVTAVGTIDSQTKSANGLVISGTDIFAQTADTSFPGLLTAGDQTIAGVKTLTSSPILDSLTATRPLKLDGSKQIISGLIDLTSEITNTLPIANGGTGQVTRQAAINGLTDVASSSQNQILTNIGGNVVWRDPSEVDVFPENSIQTTDATPTTIFGITLSPDELISFQVLITAKGPSGKKYWANITGGVCRDGASSAVLIGSSLRFEDDDGTALYTSDVTVSGNDLLVQVTGTAAETVDWKARLVRN